MSNSQLTFVPFPAISNASDDGLLAMGGDLSVNTLVSAYKQGIFPWFNPDQPILWWSPNPRLVLVPSKVYVSRSLKKVLRKGDFSITCDTAFNEVIKGCALRGMDRPLSDKAETWITDSMHEAYNELHQAGYAHSIEVWQKQTLVGGLYGVVLGNVFFGESMFSQVSNASKVALVYLCRWLEHNNFSMIDCQMKTSHLMSMGAEEIPRDEFINKLKTLNIAQNSMSFAQDFEQHFENLAI